MLWVYSSAVFPGKDARGKKPFKVIARSVIAFREFGKGNEAVRTFTTMMDMPLPLFHQSCNDLNSSLNNIYEKAAKESMWLAVNDLKETGNVSIDEKLDTDTAIDGSWQKRGNSSLNEIVTGVAREKKKIIGYKVCSKFCKIFALWESKKGTEEFIAWKENCRTDCEISCFQFSGTMKSFDAQSFSQSSVEVDKYNKRYAHDTGNGDTESFEKVTETKPDWDDLIPCKLDCVGHFQERLGTRLQKLLKVLKEIK